MSSITADGIRLIAVSGSRLARTVVAALKCRGGLLLPHLPDAITGWVRQIAEVGVTPALLDHADQSLMLPFRKKASVEAYIFWQDLLNQKPLA